MWIWEENLADEHIRAFVAVDVDEASVVSKLVEAQRALRDLGADLKLVEPENIHATVRFLGEVPTPTIELLKEQMNEVKFSAFDMEFVGLGAFPNLGRINVVWAGMRGGEEQISHIFEQLEPRFRKLGFQPDSRGFSPHVTIARVKTSRMKDALARLIDGMRDTPLGVVHVEEVRLKKSTLTPKGPLYSTIHTVRASE
jgi:RNA 2',3'-cyclic 3'-phosphodiesterase